MEQAEAKRDKEMRPGFVLSILLHVLFVAIFLLPLLPAPPQAKPEQSVNVELVPQQEEKQELATKANEKPDQPPKPTPKPDEKPQQQTADAKQERPQQPQGKKSDEQPPKQSDPQGKQPSEKPPAKPDEAKADKPEKPDDPGADKPVEKAEQQPSATETPLPDMKGDQKDPNTTQQPETSEQPKDDTPPTPGDAKAEQEQEAQAAAEAAAQAQAQAQAEAAQQAQEAQQQADAKDQQANAVQPPASDSAEKASSTAPDVLATNEPSDSQVQQPQAPSTDPNDPQAQQAAQAPSTDPQQQSPAQKAKDPPQIVVPAVKPSPAQQSSQSQSASSSQGDPASGTALVTEPQSLKSIVPKRAVQAKKLYSGAEMTRLSKSDYDAWKKLPRRQRVKYLCNSEEKMQFGRDFRAVGYVYANSALSQAMLSDISLFGDGAIVQTPNGWRRVAFTCEVDSDALKVIAFSYTDRGLLSPDQLDKLGFVGN
ncbi:DUF930 domain-containing protein [Rhizobium sp. SYY.PMSO]|uniref:DUF930 domain-containing protein n=1 Tax=Rhizobium sp. SYY.PMSO TaxID=3382192 RepID=UPI0039903246